MVVFAKPTAKQTFDKDRAEAVKLLNALLAHLDRSAEAGAVDWGDVGSMRDMLTDLNEIATAHNVYTD